MQDTTCPECGHFTAVRGCACTDSTGNLLPCPCKTASEYARDLTRGRGIASVAAAIDGSFPVMDEPWPPGHDAALADMKAAARDMFATAPHGRTVTIGKLQTGAGHFHEGASSGCFCPDGPDGAGVSATEAAETAATDKMRAALAATLSGHGPGVLQCGACHSCRTPGVLADGEMCDVINADIQLRYAELAAELAADNTRVLALSAAEAMEATRASAEAEAEAAEGLYFAQQAAGTARAAGGVARTATGYVQYPPPAPGRHAGGIEALS